MPLSAQIYLTQPSSGNTTFGVGDAIKFEALYASPEDQINTAWIEIQTPSKGWSWSGPWLNSAPFNGDIVATNGHVGLKGGSFTFTETGTHVLRATVDSKNAPGNWIISNQISLNVALAQPPQVPPGTPGGATSAGNGNGSGSSGGSGGSGGGTGGGTGPINPGDPGNGGSGSDSGGDVEPPDPGTSWPRTNADFDPGPGPAETIGILGDSISINNGLDSEGANPFDLAIAKLQTLMPQRTITKGPNQSFKGYFSGYWLDPAGGLPDLTASIAAFKADNCTENWFQGAFLNDIRVATPLETYRTNVQAILTQLLTAAPVVRIFGGTGYQVGAANIPWTTLQNLDVGDAMMDVLHSFINGTTIKKGDFGAWRYFKTHSDQLIDGVHMSGHRQGNFSGTQNLGNFWAYGKYSDLLNSTLALPQNPINNDGTLDQPKWKAYYESWTYAAHSYRLGPTHQQVFPTAPDTRPTLTSRPDVYDNFRYDHFGAGAGPFYGDGDHNNPGRDIYPLLLDSQVVPHQFSFSANGHGGNDPGNGNCIANLPATVEQVYFPAAGAGSDQYWFDFNGSPQFGYLIGSDNPRYYQIVAGGDYWSDESDTITTNENPFSDVGLAQGQCNAYYSVCFNIKPKDGYSPGPYNADPNSQYATSLEPAFSRYAGIGQRTGNEAAILGYPPQRIIDFDRGYFTYGIEPQVIDRDGVLTSAPNGTGRVAYPPPTYAFQSHERPTKLSVSTCHEFTAIVVQDLKLGQDKVVVFAVQGYGQLGNNAVVYTGFANVGCPSWYQRLGEFVPQNIKMITTIESGADSQLKAGNAFTGYCFDDQGRRDAIRNNSEIIDSASFATNGFIAIASKYEGKGELWSMQPTLQRLWNDYLAHDQATYEATRDAMLQRAYPPRWDATGQPNAPLDDTLKPTHVITWDFINPNTNVREKPTCMLASGYITADHTGENYADHDRLLVATESGLVFDINTSPIMDRFHFRNYWNFTCDIYGSFQIGNVGSNIADMIWSRFGNDNYYGLVADTGVMPVNSAPHPFLNIVHFCCRADQTPSYDTCVRFDVTTNPHSTKAGVYRTLRDSRIQDPVSIIFPWRNRVMQIADFSGLKNHAVLHDGLGRERIDAPNGDPFFPGFNEQPNPNDPNDPFCYGGAVYFGTAPRKVNANNINSLIGLLIPAFMAGLGLLGSLVHSLA